jgi:hypothetical protein
LTVDGELVPGTRTDCSAAESPLFATGLQAYSKVPPSLRGPVLRIHAMVPGSGVQGLEYEPSAGAILASGSELPEVAWLHEIGHSLTRGPRPDSLLAGRLHAALDEAVADYFAAATRESPDLGPSGRHLDRPPLIRDSDWALLGVRQAPFDPHRFGWALAARMWRESPRGASLLESVVTCLRHDHGARGARTPAPLRDTARDFISSVVGGCPTAQRQRFEQMLRQWIPDVLVDGGT